MDGEASEGGKGPEGREEGCEGEEEDNLRYAYATFDREKRGSSYVPYIGYQIYGKDTSMTLYKKILYLRRLYSSEDISCNTSHCTKVLSYLPTKLLATLVVQVPLSWKTTDLCVDAVLQ